MQRKLSSFFSAASSSSIIQQPADVSDAEEVVEDVDLSDLEEFVVASAENSEGESRSTTKNVQVYFLSH